MFVSGNQTLVKHLNQQHILNLVRMASGITARAISQQTGLKIATVLYTLKNLAREGKIIRTGNAPSGMNGGKPAALWDINRNFGFVLGVEWLSTELRLVLLDFNAQMLAKERYPFSPHLPDEEKLTAFRKQIQKFLTAPSQKSTPLLGLGLGLSGIVHHQTGRVLISPLFEKRDVHLKEKLNTMLRIPVEIDNESNAGALGVKWLMPEFFTTAHLLYFSVQQFFSGAGAGFIFNHEIYRGSRNAVGEMPPLFTAGFLKDIARLLNKKYPSGELLHLLRQSASQQQIFFKALQLARQDSPCAKAFWKEIGRQIAKRLVFLTDLLNPQAIVLGGDIFQVQAFVEPIIQRYLQLKPLSAPFSPPVFRFSPFGAYSNAMGAAALILQKIYTQ